jgi:hypothetical protein
MQWEYYRLSTAESGIDEALHDLGMEGWELVSILPESRLFHGYQCVLKRPFTGVEAPRREKAAPPQLINKYLSVR